MGEPVNLKLGYIDPGHLATPDGRRFLYLSDGRMTELAPDGLSTKGELQRVYDGWPIPEEWRIEGICLEGPKMLAKDGFYYMITAEGGTAGPATSHMVIVARSRDPYGPWENCPHNPSCARKVAPNAGGRWATPQLWTHRMATGG
jgi:beta-xylosidase